MTQTVSEVKRGEIWWADLGQTTGSEQGGVRPILVVQNDVGNKYAPTIMCAAITSKLKKYLPTHVNLAKSECGLACDSTALLEQVRTIDKSRLREKIGHVDMLKIERAIIISFGLSSVAV